MYLPPETRGHCKRTTLWPGFIKSAQIWDSLGEISVSGDGLSFSECLVYGAQGLGFQMVNLNVQNCTFVRCVHYQCTQRTWSKSTPRLQVRRHSTQQRFALMPAALYLTVLNVPHSHRCVILGAVAAYQLLCGLRRRRWQGRYILDLKEWGWIHLA